MIELIDELEAGELSVEFEGEEPEAVLEWAFERFAPRIAISTALQTDNVILIDLAYKLYPEIQVFTIDTGRLPEESHQAIEDLRDRYPGLDLRVLMPDASEAEVMTRTHGQNLFRASIDHRLLCCNVRKVRPLNRHLAGLDAWITGSPARPVGQQDEHPQDRDRPRSRRHRQAQPARRVDRGRDLGLHPRARPAGASALREGLYVDRLRAVHARDSARRSLARRSLVVGVGRAEGVRHPLLDGERRPRARAARDGDDRRAGRSAEVALGEAQAVLALAQDDERRGRLADLVAGVQAGELDDDAAQALEAIIELGLRAGVSAASTAPTASRLR